MGDFNVFCHQEGHNEKFWKLANSKNLEKSGLFFRGNLATLLRGP